MRCMLKLKVPSEMRDSKEHPLKCPLWSKAASLVSMPKCLHEVADSDFSPQGGGSWELWAPPPPAQPKQTIPSQIPGSWERCNSALGWGTPEDTSLPSPGHGEAEVLSSICCHLSSPGWADRWVPKRTSRTNVWGWCQHGFQKWNWP